MPGTRLDFHDKHNFHPTPQPLGLAAQPRQFKAPRHEMKLESSKAIFRIVTIANDLVQFAAMRTSFEQAGFVSNKANFDVFDNSHANMYNPYDVLRSFVRNCSEPYIILCHQDVRLNLSHGIDKLAEQIRLLNERHPRWAIAGNAGINRRGDLVLHLDDPTGEYRSSKLPHEVNSLDENFLLIRQAASIAPSENLSGFHHYGTDLCLNAYMGFCGAYVIDFLLTHLSAGNPNSQEFRASSDALKRAWRHRLLIGLIRPTTLKSVNVSTFSWLQKLLQFRLATKLFWRISLPLVPARPRRKQAIRTA